MAESSAATSVATGEGCQTPATSMPILGIVASAALIIPSVHTAFSPTTAILTWGRFKDFFSMAPTVARGMKLVLPRNGEFMGVCRNQYLYFLYSLPTLN